MRHAVLVLVFTAVARITQAAPLDVEEKFVRTRHPVRGEYLVMLEDSAAATTRIADLAAQLAVQHGGRVLSSWEHVVLGFAAAMPEAAAIALSRHPWVRLVEENQAIFLGATQLNAPAGIDRIDQRQLPLDSTYTFPVGASGVTST